MKRRILLVDDELAILLTLRAILEMNGFEVETAASTKEATEKLQKGVFEMLITDMRMHDNDTAGFEVIRAARQQPYDPATAILTAFPAMGTELQGEAAQSVLVKPVNTHELLRQIEALLISHQDHKMGANQNHSKKAVPVVNRTVEHATAAAKKAT